MSVRDKRRLVLFLYHGLIVGGSATGVGVGERLGIPGVISVSLLLLTAHVLTFRAVPIAGWIAQRLIRRTACCGCGMPLDLVQWWTCTCGWLSPRPRHILSPCPNCTTPGASFCSCPSCGVSIPL